MNMIQQEECYLCGVQEENIEHLFAGCEFSKKVMQGISIWGGIQLPNAAIIR